MKVEFTVYPQSPSVLYATESLMPAIWNPILEVEAIDRPLTISVDVGNKPQEYFKAELATAVTPIRKEP